MNQQFLKEIEMGSKNALVKKRIITHYIYNGSSTIPDLSKELDLSVPTVTKFIGEMCEDGYINDYGKLETSGGRHPNLYGLNPESGYFIGVDIKRFAVNIGLINFKGDMVELKMNIPYKFENSIEGMNELCKLILNFIKKLPINKEKILNISGIVNGTTNYILTRMVRTGAFFSDALREAQAKGYAEADPTADVEGLDAGRKICILADLAFGHQVDPDGVPIEGISRISLRDVKVAQRAGYRVKLLGRAVRMPGGGRTAYVAPHLIPEDNPLAGVEDVFNAVVLRGNATGEVMFYGRGAGELPTASACVADVMEALQASPRREEIGWSPDSAGFEDPLDLQTRYYFRIEGSLADAAMAFGQVEVLSEDGETAFLTDPITGRDAQRQSRSLNVLSCMRVLA